MIESCITALRTVVLDLTPETHGSAYGIGAAHTITKRLYGKIDFEATLINAVTSRGIDFVRVPAVAGNDREAIQLALRTCVGHDPANPRIIRITDSLHTEIFHISETMLGEAENKKLEILEGPAEWPFDKEGNLWPAL